MNELSEPINGFSSPGELQRLLLFLDRQIKSGNVKEVPVGLSYFTGAAPTEFDRLYERWFVDLENGRHWRLVQPDPPFYGVFLPIPREIVESVSSPTSSIENNQQREQSLQ